MKIAQQIELLGLINACQSSYHIENSPERCSSGEASNQLQENRGALMSYVQALLDARDASKDVEIAALRSAATKNCDLNCNFPVPPDCTTGPQKCVEHTDQAQNQPTKPVHVVKAKCIMCRDLGWHAPITAGFVIVSSEKTRCMQCSNSQKAQKV